MRIPAVPSIPSPPPPVFIGVAERQEQEDIESGIRDLLTRLAKAAVVPGWQEVLYKYRASVNPGGLADASRLPYILHLQPGTVTRAARAYRTLACLYHEIASLLWYYWRFKVNGEGTADSVREKIGDLSGLLEHKDALGNKFNLTQILLRCEVSGDERHGYHLVWEGGRRC